MRQAGGLVVALPRLAPEDAKHVAQFLDGIVISGGRSVVRVDAVRHRPRQF
jgi:gamma-glutamyl-gamma-aminobutyrate hydrolase PuuD